MNKTPSVDELLTQKQYALLEKSNLYQERLNRVVNQLSVVVFETDSAGNWTFLNPAWSDLTGYTLEESLGTCFLDYIHEEDRERNQQLFKPMIERKKNSCRHKIRYRSKSGSAVWVEVQASLLFDNLSNITGTAGTLTNIHEHEVALEQLVRNDQLLKASNKASYLLLNNILLPEDEMEILSLIGSATPIRLGAIINVAPNSEATPFFDRSTGSVRLVNYQQLISSLPLLKDLLQQPPPLPWRSGYTPITESDGLHHLVFTIAKNNQAVKLVILSSESRWNEHDINTLSILCHQYGMTLERNSALSALAQSEARLNMALEASNEGVWDWNIETGEVFFSDRWMSMLGYNRSEVAPDVSSWELLVHPDDMTDVMAVLQQHLNGETGLYETIHRVKAKSGDWLWILDRGKVVERNNKGEPTRAVGTHLDVSEKILAEQALAERTEQLASLNTELDTIMMISPVGFLSFDKGEQVSFFTPNFAQLLDADDSILGLKIDKLKQWLLEKHELIKAANPDHPEEFTIKNRASNKVIKVKTVNASEYDQSSTSMLMSAIDISREYELDQMKSYFMSAASHELRTPLSSISGFSELLTVFPDAYSDEEKAQMLSSIHNQAQALTAIVSQLLDVSRIESGQQYTTVMASFSLHAFIEQTVQLLATESPNRLTEIAIDENTLVYADKDHLTRILNNLITNAYKYSDKKSPVKISARYEQRNASEGVCITVTDQGMGMTKEQLEQAFDKFYRADKSGKVKGMGLGLHISKELVEIMNGDISIQSHANKGTEVTVWLPLANKEQSNEGTN